MLLTATHVCVLCLQINSKEIEEGLRSYLHVILFLTSTCSFTPADQQQGDGGGPPREAHHPVQPEASQVCVLDAVKCCQVLNIELAVQIWQVKGGTLA